MSTRDVWPFSRMVTLILVALWLIMGGIILTISIWRQGEQQLEARIYPANQTEGVGKLLMVEEDYPLPDPGILPTSPLYLAKVMVERVHLAMIVSPRLRAVVSLSYADRRLKAAQILYERGSEALAVETAAKAEGYLIQAMQEAQVSVYQDALWATLWRARQYHLRAIEAMMAVSEGTLRQTLATIYEEMLSTERFFVE